MLSLSRLGRPSRPSARQPATRDLLEGRICRADGCHQASPFSPKTLGTYTLYVRHYQTFTQSQDPKALTTEHVKAFLTSLAVDQKVSASTRNQAFNTLLFFHRHVLKKELGTVEGVVEAKRKP
jgi:hypothetical protein